MQPSTRSHYQDPNPMPQIIVLFNLKSDADRATYENWARSTDLPTVRGLQSIERFDALRSVSMLGSDAAPPYQYIEVISVNDMQTFGQEVSTDTMRKVAAQFREFADAPQFIVCEPLG